MKELVKIIEVLQENKVAFESIQQSINTRTALGRYFFHTFSTLAQFERDLIRERTLGGLAAARAAGRLGGRPPGLTKQAAHKAIMATFLYKKQKLSIAKICAQLGISKPTLYNYLRRQNIPRYAQKVKQRS